jgi:hypothetical protein
MTHQDTYDVLARRPRHRSPADPEGRRIQDVAALAMQREHVLSNKGRDAR